MVCNIQVHPFPLCRCIYITDCSLQHIITAKLEDKEDQLPSIEQMQHLAQLGNPEHHTVDEFQKMELYLLRFFNWSVSHPTPAHYADYFLTHGDALDGENPSTSPATTMQEGLMDPVTRKIQMEKYNTYFIEAALRGELAIYIAHCEPLEWYMP